MNITLSSLKSCEIFEVPLLSYLFCQEQSGTVCFSKKPHFLPTSRFVRILSNTQQYFPNYFPNPDHCRGGGHFELVNPLNMNIRLSFILAINYFFFCPSSIYLRSRFCNGFRSNSPLCIIHLTNSPLCIILSKLSNYVAEAIDLITKWSKRVLPWLSVLQRLGIIPLWNVRLRFYS